MGLMENGTRSWIPARRGREFSSPCTWVGTSHCCALALPLGLGYLCPFCVTSGFTGNWNLNTPPPLLPAFSLSNLDTFLLPSQPGLLRKECGPDVLRPVPWCPFGTAGSQGERGWGAGLLCSWPLMSATREGGKETVFVSQCLDFFGNS